MLNRHQIIPIIIAVAMFMEALDTTIVGVAIPTIANAFYINPISMKLALTSYLISLSVFIPISGWLADRFHAKRVFISALIVFIVGSALCALAHNLAMLVAARVVQGFGGAMMIPVGRLIVLRNFPKEDLVRAFSTMIVPALIGPALGPTVGGIILSFTSWHWIFLVNVPVGIAGALLAWHLLPADTAHPSEKFDWLGFALFGIGMAALAFTLATLGEGLTHTIIAVWWLIGAVVAFALYYYHARRQSYPIFNWRLFQARSFSISILGNFFSRLALAPVPFLLPILLQLMWHLTPLQSSLFFIPQAAGMMAAKGLPIANWIKKFGYQPIAFWGALSFSFVALQMMWFTTPMPFWLLSTDLFFQGLLASILFTTLGAHSYVDLDDTLYSQSTGITTITQQFSSAAAIAIAAIILNAVSHATHQTIFTPSIFRYCFILLALLSLLALPIIRYMSPDVGKR